MYQDYDYDYEDEQARLEAQAGVREQVLREQEERAREYLEGQHEGRVNHSRRRSIDLMVEAEAAKFQRQWMLRNQGVADDGEDDDDTEEDEDDENEELELKRLYLQEESDRRYNTMMARRLADEEQAVRVAEWEMQQAEEADRIAEENEVLRDYIEDLVQRERAEQIQAYQTGQDQPARAFARRRSIDFVLEAQGDAFKARFGKNRGQLTVTTAQRDQEVQTREEQHNQHMEKSERRRRSVVARDMANLEQLRRMQEFTASELEEMTPEERQMLVDAVNEEQQERVQAYEQGEDRPRRDFARRQSLNMMLEFQGDAFQRKWQQMNGDDSEDEHDFAEDHYTREQDELARQERYALMLAESDRRENILAAKEAAEEERQRRVEEAHASRPTNDMFAMVQKQAVRAARRRSLVNQVLPTRTQTAEPSEFEKYQEWAEEVMASMQDELNFKSNKTNALDQAYARSLQYIQEADARAEYMQSQFEWDQKNLDTREQQLGAVTQELAEAQQNAGMLEDMLEGSMGTLQQAQETVLSERAARVKAEGMLEQALLELAEAKRELRRR